MSSSAQSRSTPRSRSPLHEGVLARVRRDIILNRWQPGERLAEVSLCNEFGVSRTPLRDVLKILEMEGLVDLRPHAGAVVASMDSEDFADRFDVMSSLERLAAMRVAAGRPEATVKQIQRLHRSMARAAQGGKVAQYYKLNDEFHRTIVLGSGNATLSRLHETLMFHVSRVRNWANQHEPLVKAAFEHHSAIVRAIVDGNPEAAGTAMAEHLEQVAQTVLRALKNARERSELYRMAGKHNDPIGGGYDTAS